MEVAHDQNTATTFSDPVRMSRLARIGESLDTIEITDRNYKAWSKDGEAISDQGVCHAISSLVTSDTRPVIAGIITSASDTNAAAFVINAASFGLKFDVSWKASVHSSVSAITKSTESTPLFLAIQNGKLETLKTLLSLNAAVNYVNPDSLCALAIAGIVGNPAMVTELLRNGADPDLIDLNPKIRTAMGKQTVCLALIEQAIREKRPTNPGQELGFELLNALAYDSKLADRLAALFRENGKSLPHLLEGLKPEKYTDRVWKALGIDANEADIEGLTLLGRALANGDRERMRRVTELGSDRLLAYNQSAYQTPAARIPVSQQELTTMTLSRMNSYSQGEFDDARTIFNLFRSPYQLFLFTEALIELRNIGPMQHGLSLYQLAANLVAIPAAKRPLSTILASTSAIAPHPNESDFLLLLNDSSTGRSSSLGDNPVWAKFFSGEDLKANLASRKHWALARIGSQAYSFQRWQADTLSVREEGSDQREKSLLEEFGAERIAPDKGRHLPGDQFGTQFVFTFKGSEIPCKYFNAKGEQSERTIDSETTVTMRRGYHMIMNPEQGLLVIRNSSPNFGRDLLPQTACYYPPDVTRSLSAENLRHPGALFFSRAANPVSITSAEDIEHINFLLDELVALQSAYACFKFDTTLESAWKTEEQEARLTGGHRSPGFSRFVHNLGLIYQHADESGRSVSLAFVNPDYPPDRPYSFSGDQNQKEKSLLVDQEVVSQLEALAVSDEQDALPVDQRVRNFLQQAGLDRQSELLILLGE